MITHLYIPWAFIPKINMKMQSLASRVNCKIESYPKNLIAMFSLNSDILALMLLAAEYKCILSWNPLSMIGSFVKRL